MKSVLKEMKLEFSYIMAEECNRVYETFYSQNKNTYLVYGDSSTRKSTFIKLTASYSSKMQSKF